MLESETVCWRARGRGREGERQTGRVADGESERGRAGEGGGEREGEGGERNMDRRDCAQKGERELVRPLPEG